MAIAYLQPQQHITIQGTKYVLLRKTSDHEWQIEHQNTGRIDTRTEKELLSLLLKGDLEFTVESHVRKKQGSQKQIAAIDLLPKELQAETKKRYAFVLAVKQEKLRHYTAATLEPIIEATQEKLGGSTKPPHWSTVNRWYKRFMGAGQDIRAIAPQHHHKGNRVRRYDAEVIEAVQQAIENIFMKREKRRIQDTLENATTQIKDMNRLLPSDAKLALPSRSLVTSEISKLPAFDVAVARDGREAAMKKFRGVKGANISTSPLEKAEIDHTIMDIFVVDEETMMPLGRPTLTLCIDTMTRCILGLHVSFEPPSHFTVGQCLKHSMLPKLYLKETFPSVKNDWECFGAMETLVVDNGMEFHSISLESLAESFGINLQFSPRKMPWFKPYIERVFGTMNKGLIHTIPGTTFSNIFEKADYDAIKNAVITSSTLMEVIHVWVVDYYHQRIHRTLRQQPAKVWRENIDKIPVPLPANVNDLDSLIGYVEERTLSHTGIQLHSLFYNSKELTELRYRLGSSLKVSVRYSASDLGHIFVMDPETNMPIKVPALHQAYARGLTKWQHEICKRYATQHLSRSEIEALAEAKATIRHMVQTDFKIKKSKTRKRIARFMNNGFVIPTNDEGQAQEKQAVTSESKQVIPIQPQYERKSLKTAIENRTKGVKKQ